MWSTSFADVFFSWNISPLHYLWGYFVSYPLEMKTHISCRPATNFLLCFVQLMHFSTACIICVQRQWFLFLFTAVLIFTLGLTSVSFPTMQQNGSPHFCGRTSTEWPSSANRRLKPGLRHPWILVSEYGSRALLILSFWENACYAV